ncbi:MAG: hypothetical protein CBC73_03850 [Flavobacteriales bacterium TMED113]|nr:MAG: hypothetical protein CBC73_03850 [Flavobacteriales bacterium TMED113]
MIILSIIGSLFFIDKNKMLLLTKSMVQNDYYSLYIKRNLQLTYIRLLFLICSIITISAWISLMLENQELEMFVKIILKFTVIIISKKIILLFIAFLKKNLNIFKKLILITIDFEFLVCMIWFPLLFSINYIKFLEVEFKVILGLIFYFFLIMVKYFQIKKFNHLKHLSLFNIILYLCIIDLIPLIALYKIFS